MKPAVRRAKAHLLVRQKAVRRALKDLKLDGLLLTHPPDLAYLSDFTGDDSVGLLTQQDFYLVTDFRYQEQARIEAPWLKASIRQGKMSEALANIAAQAKLKRLGFEANFTTFGQVHALQAALQAQAKDKRRGAGEVDVVPVEDVLINIRKIKDDVEVHMIRQAVEAAQEAFLALRQQIQVGHTENYLAGLLGFEMRCRGASDSSFATIVAAGAASSLPHYRPGERLVQRDQPLLIDWGARFKGYCSDLTRTLLIGRVSPRMKRAYNVTLEAQQAAIDFLRPGVTTRQADRVARDLIDKAGFRGKFGHGLGHGIGRDIHELPGLSKTGPEDELRPGMIVTVEPGIYLPGLGGVRIEDDVMITHGGHEVLSSLDKSYEGCHLE
jgi:Xaa-Pro aminopeptidase